MPESPLQISAVILAAGLSSRMKDFKPLLRVGDETMVEAVIHLFQKNHIIDIVVVTGHRSEELSPFVKNAGAIQVHNPHFRSGMLGSIQKGIKNINTESSGFFLLPVDIPAVRSSTVHRMILEFQKASDNVIMPCFDDRSGHPPLVPCTMKKDILDLKTGSSLRDLIFSPATGIKQIKVHDRGILMDADDKKGYARVCEKIQSSNIPDREECLSIINEFLPRDESIRSHLTAVCRAASKIANAVSDGVNADLVIAASMLHDIKRKEKYHAAKGADLINDIGFKEVAAIIAQHMDIDIDFNARIMEKEIVYFADKICAGSDIDPDYHKRFALSMVKSPWARIEIKRRYENTKHIQTRIEASAGKSIKRILSV